MQILRKYVNSYVMNGVVMYWDVRIRHWPIIGQPIIDA